MNDDSCDLETARLLLDAIRNEPFCDDPTCCPPKEPPVLTNPYTIIKTTAAVLIALFLTLFVIVMVLG